MKIIVLGKDTEFKIEITVYNSRKIAKKKLSKNRQLFKIFKSFIKI